MKRITKQNKIIVGVISLVLVLTVGYALFSETLNINGTAKASGNFNLIFSEVLRNNVKKEGATIDVNNITIKDESKTLSIGDVTLNYPSAYVSVPAKIKNEGTIDAVLKGIRVENPNVSEIEVSYDGVKKDELFKSGEEKEITIMIRWKKESTIQVEKQDFNIYLDYEQAPDGYAPPASEEMTRDMFVWDSETVVAGLSDKGIEHLRNNGGKLVIPEGTTEIASPTFDYKIYSGVFDKGFSTMVIGKENDMSSSVKEENMIISSVKFPTTLEKIGDFAFWGQAKFVGILSLPNRVKEIGNESFLMTGIEKLEISNSVEIIKNSAFEHCENLSGILEIPGSVKTIEKDSFAQTSITFLKLNEGLESIGRGAFYGIQINDELIIPNSVKKIGEGAFQDTSIKSLKLGSGLKTIEISAFENCKELSGNLYIPDSVEMIGDYAFYIDSWVTNNVENISISNNTVYETYSFEGRPTPTIRD